MAYIAQPWLFSWREIDTASDLDRLRLVLMAVSPYDQSLMLKLETLRGKGRDDYPVRAMWNSVFAGIVYQHVSAASLLRELARNAEMRELCGFDPLLGVKAVPSDHAFGRFLETLMEQSALVIEMFHALLTALETVLPDLGTRLAVDSKAIQSFGRPVTDEEKKTGEPDRRRDVDADWGTKSYKGVHADGTAWSKITHWFGYKLHLAVDSKYELPVAFKLTKASAGDSPELLPLVNDLVENHDPIAARAEELAADRGYDSADNKATLFDAHGIKPFIDHRQMWKEEPGVPRPLFGDRVDSFLFDEMGNIYCRCPTEQHGGDELRRMFFVGFEKDRGTLKYRCPAAGLGCECPGRADCERLAPRGVGEFGRTLRVPLDTDRRIFTPVARHTRNWEKSYDRRTSIERVNSRLDQVLNFEHHTIRGKAKMELRVTLALVVMLAMALGRIQANQADMMRSLTAPVRRAA
jgi:hypothetical protein